MTSPVVRMWEAQVARDRIEDWISLFRERAFPGMRGVEGFQEVRFLAAREGDPCHVTVLTTWDDMDAVQRYAGKDAGKTVMPEFMEQFFASYDPRASFHDEIMREARS